MPNINLFNAILAKHASNPQVIDYLIGWGNPESDILVIGTEALAMGQYYQQDIVRNIEEWLTNLAPNNANNYQTWLSDPINNHAFNPCNALNLPDYNWNPALQNPHWLKTTSRKKAQSKQPKNYGQKGIQNFLPTNRTWMQYQKLHDYKFVNSTPIYQPQLQPLDFFKHFFVTDLSTATTTFQGKASLPVSATRASINNRIPLFNDPFFQDFKKVVINGSYVKRFNINVQSLFNVSYVQTVMGSIDIYQSSTKTVIVCHHLCMVSNAYLQTIASYL